MTPNPKPLHPLARLTITVIQGIDDPTHDGVTITHEGEPLSLLRALGALEAAKHIIQSQLTSNPDIEEP